MSYYDEELVALKQIRASALAKIEGDLYMGADDLESALAGSKLTSQAEVLARLLNRENLFISGPAGSGKSSVINRFVEWMDALYDGNINIAITASTGIASALIGGRTIHSWSGLGAAKTRLNLKNIPGLAWSARSRILESDVLVIDEISMLPAYFFEDLDKLLRYFRRDKRPFGGIQLILMGDFLQLPPVPSRDNEGNELDSRFAIHTEAWAKAKLQACYLDKVHRTTDKRLKYALAHIAAGKVDELTKQIVESREGLDRRPDKAYTKLFTINRNIDAYNAQKLAENPHREERFRAIKQGNATDVQKLMKQNNIIETLALKMDATVMVTANVENAQNGSLGKIVGLSDEQIVVRLNDGRDAVLVRSQYKHEVTQKAIDPLTKKQVTFEEVTASVYQFPVKLGYAISVHKSQGQTFDGVEADLSKCFAAGLGYVALSRVRDLDDLIVTNLNKSVYSINEDSLEITKKLRRLAKRGRAEFVENLDHYQKLLTDDDEKSAIWSRYVREHAEL